MTAGFFVGSYAHAAENGIHRFRADFDNRRLSPVLSFAGAECPSYVLRHPARELLYAVRELTEEGGLYAFSLRDNAPKLVSEVPTLGKDPCFLSLDDSVRYLFAANYSGGSFSVFQLDAEGLPAEMTAHIQHQGSGPDPERQEMAHPHCAVNDGGWIYVCDLGLDRLFRYRLDAERGTLAEEWSAALPAGAGPRHLCVSKRNPGLLYVAGELSSAVYVLRRHARGAELLQTLSTLPEGFTGTSTAAAIRLAEDGRALFVSNRGDDSVAAFRVLPDGLLERTGVCKTGGRTPRDFDVFGNHLVVANQDSDSITVLDYDAAAGTLTQSGMTASVLCPTCIHKIEENDDVS